MKWCATSIPYTYQECFANVNRVGKEFSSNMPLLIEKISTQTQAYSSAGVHVQACLGN